MYYYLKHRITPTAFKLALFLILIIDLWRVDYRPMETQPASMLTSTFAPTDVDRFLKQDTSEQYRVLDVTTPQPNFLAYQFHQHILGYSSAKMRNYQDLLDVAGTNGNVPTSPLAWNLLNTKYIIAQGPIAEGMQPVFVSKEKQAQVFENTNRMPRAWFVNRLEVADGLTILNKIKDNGFDPRDVAYIPDSSKGVMAGINPVSTAPKAPAAGDTTAAGDSTTQAPATTTSGGGSAHITRYEPLHIAMDVEAPGPEKNFLVVSEIYYPPAWRATIDGKPAQIVQTNYLLRGLVVPAGRHKIEMNYVSEGFETGKWTSLALNIAAFAAIAVGVILERRKPQEIDPEHEGPMVDEDDV
jgi:hypothetical protein